MPHPTILTGWFVVVLSISTSTAALLPVLTGGRLAVGPRWWGVAGRWRLLRGRSLLLVSALLAVGALLSVAALLALIATLLLLGIRVLFIPRSLLTTRAVTDRE